MQIHDFEVLTLTGERTSLRPWAGQVLLIVNVASRCGFTPQYAGLEALWQRYRARGFAVLGFPCNQFGGQEPGTATDIRTFCDTRYGITFPLFAKLEVNGPAAHPLYRHLKSSAPGVLGSEAVKWNFTKFLVDRDGRVVRRYGSVATPAQLAPDIERLL